MCSQLVKDGCLTTGSGQGRFANRPYVCLAFGKITGDHKGRPYG